MSTVRAAGPVVRRGPRPRVGPAPVVAAGLAGAAVVVAALVGVALADLAPGRIADPGAAVRVLGPVASALGDLAGAVTVAALVLAALAVPERSSAFALAVRVGAVAAVVWGVASVAGIVTAYAVASGASPAAPGFGTGLQLFVGSFELGQYLLASALLVALTAVLAAAATGAAGAGVAALAALAALVPVALSGHAGSAADHETATTSMGLHLVGISVWVGGLLVLAALGRRLGDDRVAVTARYSGLALAAALLVALSGVLNASTRVESWADLDSPYGTLVSVKAALTLLLLAAGAAHRTWTLRRMRSGAERAFWWLLGVEALVMAATVGVAVALSTTAPPVSESSAPVQWSPAEVVAGYPLPPPPDLARYLTQWQPDVLWLVLGGAALLGYLGGVRRLQRRGDRWPVLRTLAFAAGIAVLVWVTSGGPAVYGRWSFSGHMIQHMTLATTVPILLVAGAPLLLALRALRPRRDGSRGAREWLLAVVHAPAARVLTHPAVAAAGFVVGMAAFYYSPLFSLALRTHLGHELMTAHFLLTGYLFAWVLVGADPGARRVAHPFRLLVLLAAMAFHALFGVALLQGEALLAAEYWTVVAEGRPWGDAPLRDQQVGGSLAWGLGEAPTLVLALAVAGAWAASDTRESRRRDRRADRDGDADLAAYNDMLARLPR